MTRVLLLASLCALGSYTLVACSGGEGESANGGLFCSSPPAEFCRGDVLVSYEDTGALDALTGQCTYAERLQPCANSGQICEIDACVDEPPDPCIGVTCAAPPASVCEGDTARVFDAVGVCTEGRCVYGDTRTDCAESGQVCEEAACVDPPDPCEGVDCSFIPPSGCVGSIAVVYTEGVCVDGSCRYEDTRTDCAEQGLVCVGGACVESDPCEGVICPFAPPECEGDVLVLRTNGRCVDGLPCAYDEERLSCAADGLVCFEGACVEDTPCQGVTCETPPAPYCEGVVLNAFEAPGECTYNAETEEERCDYTLSLQDCSMSDQLCRDGACVDASPCEGEECLSPPGARCDGDTLVVSDVPGVCSDDTGACSYGETRTDCAARGQVCFDGECLDDDGCVGVLCNAPPSPECSGNLSTEYFLPGECVAGSCIYTSEQDDCTVRGEVCVDGYCAVLDPCAGVACPPVEPGCLGQTLVETVAPGFCEVVGELASCNYEAVEVRVDCEESGQICFVDRCAGRGTTLFEGSVIITEVSLDGADQWIELYEPRGEAIDLAGLVVANAAGDRYEIPAGVALAPYGYVVLASNPALGDAIDADATWDGESLSFASSGDDALRLLNGGDAEIARTTLGGALPFSANASVQLDALFTAAGSDDAAHWCPSGDALDGGGFGSPGSANTACVDRLGDADIRINELFFRGDPLPFGGEEQWLELANEGTEEAALAGLELVVEGDTLRLPADATLAAGGLLVIATSDSAAGGTTGQRWAELNFSDDAGTVALRLPLGGAETAPAPRPIDAVSYGDGWPLEDGASLSRSEGGASDDPADWCSARTDYPSEGPMRGTPGAPNDCEG